MTWLDVHAAAIQAVSAAFGLVGLIWYCVLTLQIRKATVSQSNAAIRPFVVLDEMRDADAANFELNLKPISVKEDLHIP